MLTQLPLFADPDVTAWWWNTHQHLPARVRLDIVTQTLPLCANEDSAGVLRAVQEDLQAFLKPVSAGQAALDNARELALEHPWFAGIALICLAGLLFKAGAALAGGATLAGADDFVEARLWGREQLPFLRRLLPFRHGIPSHDTLNDVINALAPELFKTCFVTPPTPMASVPAGMEP